MMKKNFCLLFMALLFVCSSAFSMKDVVFVKKSSRDDIVIDAIKSYAGGAAFNVTVLTKAVIEIGDTALFNASDLVIMGRSLGSSDVGAAKAVWDSITSPVLSMNCWGLRNLTDKGFWVDNVNCDNIVSNHDTVLQARILVDDPVFDGLSSDTIDYWNGDFSVFLSDSDHVSAGNGTLLAESADKRPLFIRWEAGVEFYPGAGHAPRGERSYIGNGCDNKGDNYFGFTDAGESIFFNELVRMSGYVINEIIFVKTNANDRDSAAIANISNYADGLAYNVTVVETPVITLGQVDQFNAADLVIMGRSIGSSDVGTGAAAWDSITSPVLSMNMWGLRGLVDKAWWTTNANCQNVTSDPDTVLQAKIFFPDDPVFEGISSATIDYWTGMFSVFGTDYNDDNAGNGITLAETVDNRPLFIRWAAGVEFYPGAGHAPKGDRTYIGNGNDNTTLNYFGFTEEGASIFFKEMARLVSGVPTVIPSLNRDATLSALEISTTDTIKPGFDANTLDYTVALPAGSDTIPSVTVATSTDVNAVVDIVDAASRNGVATITVTAEDPSVSKVYTISFSALSRDVTLSVLEASAGSLVYDLNADSAAYIISLPSGTTDVPTITTATPTNGNAEVAIIDAVSLDGEATITVTAEDTTAKMIYTVSFIILPSTDATLSALTVSEGALDPEFNPETESYNVNLPSGTIDIPTITTATPNDSKAKVVIADAASFDNDAIITVTAEDTSVTKVYTVSYTVLPNTDATLSALATSAGTLDPVFHADTLSYTVELPAGTTVVPTVTTATANDNKAAVDIVDASSFDEAATITVTAEDPGVTRVYTINYKVVVGMKSITSNNIQIYPTVVDKTLNIVNIKSAVVSIYTIEGTLVNTVNNVENNSTIDVSNLNSGTYLIKIQNGNSLLNTRFIKK